MQIEPECDAPGAAQRRSFVVGAALAFAGVGLTVATYPLLASLAPSRGAPDDVVRVDLTTFPEATERHYRWTQYPILVRHRKMAEVLAMQNVPPLALADRSARRMGLADLPATDANRTLPGRSRWLVLVALCTYRNCIIHPRPATDLRPLDETWICPCCASRYDASGRIRSGPARQNLAVPPYRLQGATLEIGVL